MNSTTYRCVNLGRDGFNEAVFVRDGHRCVVCGAISTAAGGTAKLDAHHILDRRLWDDGGYFVENGVSLCEQCHLKAEMTIISCEELRRLARITVTVIPEHLAQDEGEVYDKWGNQILPLGNRLKGELFNDLGCQRMLKEAGFHGAIGILDTFGPHVKYPRTMHLPWSENLQNNDRKIKSLDAFHGQEVVVTEKRDGENTSFYPDYMHARSIDSKDHPSRAIVRQLHAAFAHEIPIGWRICAENLYATHSIKYHDLPAWFEVFNIWNENNEALAWDETVEYASMIGVGIGAGFENGLPLVPVLYRGIWNEDAIREIHINKDRQEGYVVRLARRIRYSEWRFAVAKFVRAKHVETDEHWQRTWRPNQLRS